MAKHKRTETLTAIQAAVGQRMAWARDLVEPNRSEFARLLGCDVSTLNKIEDGSRAPSIFVVRDYARKLRMTTDFFLEGRLGGDNDPELERLLIAHHPTLVLGAGNTHTVPQDTAPRGGTSRKPRKPA